MSPVPSPAPQPPPSISLPVRHKQKSAPVGIAAGAEDAKYHVKYKELKRKVKDIEADNDKLHFKVLQAKLSIRRMKMERAVLYERLSVIPPSPTIQDRHPLPPAHPVAGGPAHQLSSRPPPGRDHHREIRDHLSSMDPDQSHLPQEHIRSQPALRLPPDARSAPPMDNSSVALSPHMSVRSPRRMSSAHDSTRHHLPPMPQIPAGHLHQYETARGHSQSNSHASPSLHHTHPSSSHSRNRSHSSSHSRSQHGPPQTYRDVPGQYQHHPESLPSVHQPMHSPPPSERERPRRGDPHEFADESHLYDRHQPLLSSGRIHSHQRLGPGTYITRDEFQDKRGDLEREREWEREHEREQGRNREYTRSREISSYQMHSPPHSVQRSRSQIDRGDYDPHMPPRSREDPAYYHDSHLSSGYPRLARSDTPGSGSASGSGAGVADVPSRPDSRSQYYERDRARNYRLRPVSQPNEDVDFLHEDSRSQSGADRGAVGVGGGGGTFAISDQSRPSMDSRKRTRHDMEVESDNDVGDGPSGSGSLYPSGRPQEDRGSSKRYHREHPRRSVDTHEDSRMAAP
ncbi:hypothetical protein JR316_0004633 [Psilocybe cubensis]|uniref:Uncharacterized protein n=2 Tax=Psilocybe cubensis TaxID=181762 RepID=A0ACB8H418_PSICU|nr:hypothetical protein JR316_0004633 [Psilocybe cubensis]KAH9482533.1 hypothetical protein JR316_0004633 [Psilocybe cubensis]